MTTGDLHLHPPPVLERPDNNPLTNYNRDLKVRILGPNMEFSVGVFCRHPVSFRANMALIYPQSRARLPGWPANT